MPKRRSRGDGGLYWDKARQRWIASVTTGYTASGKRIVRKASARTKDDAKDELKDLVRDLDDGLAPGPANYTVSDAVHAWLSYGLGGRDPETVKNYRNLAAVHIISELGNRKLRQLSAEDVDKWLAGRANQVSTRTLRLLHSLLNRAVKHAMARDKVKRNVVTLCEIPTGRVGRPSKSLTLEQAEAILTAAEGSDLHAYVVMSLLIGARTEELRVLTWDHVDLIGEPAGRPPVPRSISVWHSVRAGGDTKTRKSRRTLALPRRCVVALRLHRIRQREAARNAGRTWSSDGLVFPSRAGTPLDSHNVRRTFRRVVKAAGLQASDWTPRELRHSFVSLLSADGMRVEDISRLCGHSGTAVTEQVYRHEIRPVMEAGAQSMDAIFRARRGTP